MFTDQEAYSKLKKFVGNFPDTLVVLGSGWNKVLDDIKIIERISYENIFGVKSSVPGHNGELVIGQIGEKRIAFMSGRFHTYEGYGAEEATTPVRVFAKSGIKNLIMTSAVGALNEKYKVGDFVILNDVITILQVLDNPLKGPKFIDMSQVFDGKLRQKAIDVSRKLNIRYREGIYIYYHGPNFESPADKRALRILGADVTGMSMIPEVIVARSLNLRILGLAFVTNLAFVKHDHKEVLREAEKAGKKMKNLILGLIKKING